MFYWIIGYASLNQILSKSVEIILSCCFLNYFLYTIFAFMKILDLKILQVLLKSVSVGFFFSRGNYKHLHFGCISLQLNFKDLKYKTFNTALDLRLQTSLFQFVTKQTDYKL